MSSPALSRASGIGQHGFTLAERCAPFAKPHYETARGRGESGNTSAELGSPPAHLFPPKTCMSSSGERRRGADFVSFAELRNAYDLTTIRCRPAGEAAGDSVNRMVDTVKVSAITSRGVDNTSTKRLTFVCARRCRYRPRRHRLRRAHARRTEKARWQICGTRDRPVLIEVSLAPGGHRLALSLALSVTVEHTVRSHLKEVV
jgi:hypothetical protein